MNYGDSNPEQVPFSGSPASPGARPPTDHHRASSHRVRTVLLTAVGVIVLASGIGIGIGIGAAGKRVTGHSATGGQGTPHKALAGPPSSTNERLFIYGLASGTSVVPPRAIAGNVMTTYISLEAMINKADAAAGNPDPAGTVSGINGGYRVCWSYTSGSQCSTYTSLRTDSAGRVTDVRVNGQLVSGRIGTGTAASGSGLLLSDVTSYRPAKVNTPQVYVCFRLRDVSSTAMETGSPSALAVFDTPAGHFSEDDNLTAVLPTLRPGETVIAVEVFDTSEINGTFSLRTNNGYEAVLASATIHRVR